MASLTLPDLLVKPTTLAAFPALTPFAPELPWSSDADLAAMAEDSAALDAISSGLSWL